MEMRGEVMRGEDISPLSLSVSLSLIISRLQTRGGCGLLCDGIFVCVFRLV